MSGSHVLRLLVLIISIFETYCVTTPPTPTPTLGPVFVVALNCTTGEVTYTVYNGKAGGMTFVEGSQRESAECITTLSGVPAENFTMNYGHCGATPIFQDERTLTFVILVQDYPLVNTFEDARYRVICTFSESETSISTTLLTATSGNITYQEITFETDPDPQLTLYYRDAEPVDRSRVKLGTPLTLEIRLIQGVPGYEIIALKCTMSAEYLSGQVIGREVILISDSDNCATMEDTFPSFTYGYDDLKDSASKVYTVPVLTSDFNVFTPTLIGAALSSHDIYIIVNCRVRVCVRGGATCVTPTCPAPVVRRKRQDNDTSPGNIDPVFDLRDAYRVSLFSDDTADESSVPTSVHIGENEICMERLAFWGALLTLLALLVAAWIALCCFFIFVRRRRRREKKIVVYEDDKSSVKESTITPVESYVVEKPLKTIPMVLPRYHAADVAMETVETRVEYE